MSHPSLIFKIKQINMKSLLVHQSLFPETQFEHVWVTSGVTTTKREKTYFQWGFSKCISHTQERHTGVKLAGGISASERCDISSI